SSFKPIPAHSSALSGREIPPVGGETEFASMRVAYTSLSPAAPARLEGKGVVDNIIYSGRLIAKDLFDPEQARALPAVRHALVRANPAHGRKAFYIGSPPRLLQGTPSAA